MNYLPHSPFPIPRGSNGLISSQELTEYWVRLDEALGDKVSESVGCYIFSIRSGRGCLPWYVGRAEKQSFRRECFAPHKLNHYNNAIGGRKGTPLLTLIAKYTSGTRLVGPTGKLHSDIRRLETILIANALSRNPQLRNIHDAALLRKMHVAGLLNAKPGKPAAAVSQFRALLGIG
jgi:hypothetical protein